MPRKTNPTNPSLLHVDVRTAPRAFEDASGAPAIIASDGYVFACDCLGEIKINLIAPVYGSRVVSRVASERVRRAYAVLLAAAVDANWIERNAALYAEAAS